MKKFIIAIVAVIGVAAIVVAGSVYGRTNITLSKTGASATQLDFSYSAVALKRVWLLNSAASQTVTLKRVDASGVNTQTVCVINSTTTNSTATFTAGYLLPSDTLITTGTTNGTVQLEYEVQKH